MATHILAPAVAPDEGQYGVLDPRALPRRHAASLADHLREAQRGSPRTYPGRR